eukprot:241162_1
MNAPGAFDDLMSAISECKDVDDDPLGNQADEKKNDAHDNVNNMLLNWSADQDYGRGRDIDHVDDNVSNMLAEWNDEQSYRKRRNCDEENVDELLLEWSAGKDVGSQKTYNDKQDCKEEKKNNDEDFADLLLDWGDNGGGKTNHRVEAPVEPDFTLNISNFAKSTTKSDVMYFFTEHPEMENIIEANIKDIVMDGPGQGKITLLNKVAYDKALKFDKLGLMNFKLELALRLSTKLASGNVRSVRR